MCTLRPLAFYYDHEAIAHYHNAFAQQPLLLRQQIAALMAAYHAQLSPAIGYEEQLLLAECGTVPDTAQAQQFVASLVKTLHTHEGPFADSIHAWVHRLSRRQHTAPIWHDEVLAAAWATVHLEQLQAEEPLILPAGLDLARVSWLLAQGSIPRGYTLRQRGQMLCVEAEAPTTDANVLDAPGSPLTAMSAIAPYLQVQLIGVDGAYSAAQLQALDQAIPLSADANLLLRTDHQELTIDSIPRPAWAESIGRDTQGLFVTWTGGQRRAYWVPPGVYAVYNRGGRTL